MPTAPFSPSLAPRAQYPSEACHPSLAIVQQILPRFLKIEMHNSFSPKDTSEYERVFRLLMHMYELSRTAVVEPCNAVGLDEHRLLNRKKIKGSDLPKLEAVNLSGLDSSEKESLLNTLEMIEMNAEMLMCLSTVLKKTIVAKCKK